MWWRFLNAGRSTRQPISCICPSPASPLRFGSLEEELGIQFFRRSNRGVEFTPEGKEFLSYAVSLLEQKQRIEGLYGQNRNAAAPERFSVSTQRYPFTEDAFLRMLQATQESRFRFSLKETGMDAVIDDVYDHRSDIGVIFLTELTEKMIRRLLDARELVFHEIASVDPCIYVRKDHPWRAARACLKRMWRVIPMSPSNTPRAWPRISLRSTRRCP